MCVGCWVRGDPRPTMRPAACRRDQIRQTEEKEAPLATRMPTDITEMKLWQLEGMPNFGFVLPYEGR